MYEGGYATYWHKLATEAILEDKIKEQRHLQNALKNALHAEQIKGVYRNSSKIADVVYIQGYGEFLLDKNDNLIKVQKEQDNEL